MRIGDLARRAGVSASSIRYYERLGLLPRGRRSQSGYRQYDDAALARLSFILRAKEVGFSLPEIAMLLASDQGRDPRGAERLVIQKLRDIAAQRRALQVVETRLRRLRTRLQSKGTKGELTRWLLLTEEVAMSEPTRAPGPFSGFDDTGRKVLRGAITEAANLRHGWVGAEHLLIALVAARGGQAAAPLRSAGITAARTRDQVVTVTGRGAAAASEIALTPRLQTIIGFARGLALHDERPATADDLFLALLESGETVASAVLVQQRADLPQLRAALVPRDEAAE